MGNLVAKHQTEPSTNSGAAADDQCQKSVVVGLNYNYHGDNEGAAAAAADHQHDDLIAAGGLISRFTRVLPNYDDSKDDDVLLIDWKKVEWLRDQIIGGDAEFDTPFGRRPILYADHTASGRLLRCVEDFIATQVLPFYGNTHTGDSYVGSRMSEMVKEASNYIKDCMGASHERDSLLFCGTGTTAAIKRLQEVMGVYVPSLLRERVLKTMDLSERWVVFVGPYEHHSNLLSWRHSLAEVVEIGLDEFGHIDIKSLVESIELPEYADRPKLGSFSACSNVTGIHTDTREIARALHAHGAYACFDFACSGPYVEIKMHSGEEDGYDAVFMSPHKFMGGPCTPGILVINNELYRLKGVPPSTSGGGTVQFVNGYSEETIYYEDVEEREDAGTPGIVQKIRTALAFSVKEFIGYKLMTSLERGIIERALNGLSENDQVRVLGVTKYESSKTSEADLIFHQLPIISFLVYPKAAKGKHLHSRFVTKLLNDLFGIQARGGCSCAGPYGHHLLGVDHETSLSYRSAIEKGYEGIKPGWTRVSFCYYNSLKEVDYVLKAIRFVAEFGLLFQELYEFDWRSGDWKYLSQVKDNNNKIGAKVVGLLNNSSTNTKRSVPQDIDQTLIRFFY